MIKFGFKKIAAGFSVIAIVVLAAIGSFVWLVEREGPADQDNIIWVKPGSSLSSVATMLERDGLVASAEIVKLFGRLTQSTIRAGEFVIPAYSSVSQIVRTLETSAPYQRQITIPEGWNVNQVFAHIETADHLEGDLPDRALIKEGSLLPETYKFDRGTKRADLIDRMQREQVKAFKGLLHKYPVPPEIAALDTDHNDAIIILASIVEKEAGYDGERGRIARAFLNRLARGMKLEADPTVIYAVELAQGGKPMDRPIYKRDLRLESPYNTYHAPGLPPGPIANPGLASIEAVLNAPKGDELFFVADGTGGHAFSSTLAGHNKNVRKWRAIERQRKAAN